ncbi:questin oxidase family protein [Streptomyces sp. NPDC005438]|uniref:questin oxidase family protein n=1 Tax=Streptomyces sp. NPDC005438 TaxID=3156880 RepID=UPI0033A7C07A
MKPNPTDGVHEEALERLHTTGPERDESLSNHAPMVVEALTAHGHSPAVHRWLDRYRDHLEEFPARHSTVTEDNWRRALGDSRRAADWIDFFDRTLAERPWREVLATWWPHLLPGIAGGATHPVIRVGHAVRALRADEIAGPDARPAAPRVTELAHGLGYWAARHHPVAVSSVAAPSRAAVALDQVPPVLDASGGFATRLARISRLPDWAGAVGAPEQAERHLRELVAATTHRYASHGHGRPVMLVHAATAPNAVLRALPALPHALWAPSLVAAWTASATVTAAYPTAEPVTPRTSPRLLAEEVFERALRHGDEHAVKFTDTALDVGDPLALTAALRSLEIIDPLE